MLQSMGRKESDTTERLNNNNNNNILFSTVIAPIPTECTRVPFSSYPSKLFISCHLIIAVCLFSAVSFISVLDFSVQIFHFLGQICT